MFRGCIHHGGPGSGAFKEQHTEVHVCGVGGLFHRNAFDKDMVILELQRNLEVLAREMPS